MKKLLCVLAALMLLSTLLVSCGEQAEDENIKIPIRTGNVINYNTTHARIGTILEQVTLSGDVTTPYNTDLCFTRTGGTILSFDVRPDQEFKAGDVIAMLDTKQLEDDIVVQKIRLDNAQSTYDNLVSSGAAESDIEFARINLELEQIDYDDLISKRDYMTLRAPFDGKIVSVAELYPGSEVKQNQTICTMSDSSKVCLTVSDYGQQLSNVSFGTKVDVVQGTFVSTTGKVVDTITRDMTIRNENGDRVRASVVSYVISCDEDVSFSELGGVDVVFTTLRRDEAVIVPTEAVFEATADLGGAVTNYVNVLMNGIKIQTPVSVGVSSNGETEITSGLEGSETLILG